MALLLEVVASVIGTVLAVADPGGVAGLAWTGFAFLLLALAYVLRLQSEAQYDTAETMRRQSVFTEALGWPIRPWQMSQWRQRIGKHIRDHAKETPRDPDYYATQRPIGALRLADMTTESAFYTYHVYCMLQSWILRATISVAVLALVLLMLPFFVADGHDEVLGRILYAFLPVVFTVDLVGWWLRLGRTIENLDGVQKSLEDLRSTDTRDEKQVLRATAEYNSQVANGIPIPNWLFNRWHDEIRLEWESYLQSLHGSAIDESPIPDSNA